MDRKSESIKAMAKQHGVTPGTILRWLCEPMSNTERVMSPAQRINHDMDAAGLLSCPDAARVVGVGSATLHRAAQHGELHFELVHGIRAFKPEEVESWRTRRDLKKAVGAGPVVTPAQAARLLNYASASTVLHHVRSGRLQAFADELGRRWLRREEVEAFGDVQQAKKALRA